MNKYFKSFLVPAVMFAIVLISACEDDDVMPSLSVVATPTTVALGDTIYFHITGNADAYAIFTGERGRNYDSSYLAIADGQEVDLSALVLTADSLDSAISWLQTIANSYNNQTNNANEQLANDTTIADSAKVYQDTIVFDNMLADLQEFIVGNVFHNREEAIYYLRRDAIPYFTPFNVNKFIDDYFEDQGTYLAPQQGYDTGVALDRYDLDYEYVYTRKGEYTVTVIATNVSNKRYSGSGARDDRTASSSDYKYHRLIRQVTVTVE